MTRMSWRGHLDFLKMLVLVAWNEASRRDRNRYFPSEIADIAPPPCDACHDERAGLTILPAAEHTCRIGSAARADPVGAN